MQTIFEDREVRHMDMLKFSSDHLKNCAWISISEVDFGVWQKNEKKASQYSNALIFKK